MLGLNRQNNVWRWNAVGKHPAAADYINVMGGTPLMEAMSEWMTMGYDALGKNDKGTIRSVSWRFWLRGEKKGRLICGLGRDSSDRIGRPFPLLVFGEGPLKGWEKHWTMLPRQLAPTWERIERTAARRFADLKELTRALQELSPPSQADIDSGQACGVGVQPGDQDLPGEYKEVLLRTGRVLIPLKTAGSDPAVNAVFWHSQLRIYCRDVPRAVFLGGTPQHNYLMVIQQPLATSDFIMLWGVS